MRLTRMPLGVFAAVLTGVTVDERQLAFVEAVTERAPGASQKRLDGSLTHW
jgi:hypothetical protein